MPSYTKPMHATLESTILNICTIGSQIEIIFSAHDQNISLKIVFSTSLPPSDLDKGVFTHSSLHTNDLNVFFLYHPLQCNEMGGKPSVTWSE
jgi:hypothetical protein